MFWKKRALRKTLKNEIHDITLKIYKNNARIRELKKQKNMNLELIEKYHKENEECLLRLKEIEVR